MAETVCNILLRNDNQGRLWLLCLSGFVLAYQRARRRQATSNMNPTPDMHTKTQITPFSLLQNNTALAVRLRSTHARTTHANAMTTPFYSFASRHPRRTYNPLMSRQAISNAIKSSICTIQTVRYSKSLSQGKFCWNTSIIFSVLFLPMSCA